MDLAFWMKKPIFIAVNINSRIGYAKLLKNKKAETVQKIIDQFITDNSVTALMSDNGTEFTNNIVEKFFDKNSITHANALPGDHTVLGKIDRFIRTIKAILTKMNIKKLTQKILDDAIKNYNSTIHSAIHATPNSMEGKVIYDDIDYNKKLVKQVLKDIPPGSIVRYKLKPKTFDKEGAKYSKAVYEVIGLDGLKMHIRSKNNHVLYKPVNELKIVQSTPTDVFGKSNDIHEVEKILDHKTLKNGKNKYLVKWIGDDEPTWESQDNIRIFNKNKMSSLEKNYFRPMV